MLNNEINALDENALRLEVARVLGWVEKFGRMDKASSRIHQYFVKPDGRISLYPPDWPRDMRAAWELAEEAKLIIIPHYLGWAAGTSPNGEFYPGPTAPIAICRAWLAWKAGR